MPKQDVAALEKAHAGAFERDTTPEELKAILWIQKKVRAEMRAAGGRNSRQRRQ